MEEWFTATDIPVDFVLLEVQGQTRGIFFRATWCAQRHAEDGPGAGPIQLVFFCYDDVVDGGEVDSAAFPGSPCPISETELDALCAENPDLVGFFLSEQEPNLPAGVCSCQPLEPCSFAEDAPNFCFAGDPVIDAFRGLDAYCTRDPDTGVL